MPVYLFIGDEGYCDSGWIYGTQNRPTPSPPHISSCSLCSVDLTASYSYRFPNLITLDHRLLEITPRGVVLTDLFRERVACLKW